jgi:hypothetical protein
MVFRRAEPGKQVEEEDEDGLNIISADDEDEEEEPVEGGLFELGQQCDICSAEEGIVGLDPTVRGAYDGTPVLYGTNCLPEGLKAAYAGVEGIGVIVEPFDEYSDLYYYRLDEMPAYQFVREDIEAISWLLLTIGGPCARCGEQSRFAVLNRDFVDPRLPEGEPVFRNMEADAEQLCGACAGQALARACLSLALPLMTVELPRSAMGIIMPTGE